MSKAFTRESDGDDEDFAPEFQIPAGARNYITPAGHARLKNEFNYLWKIERPQLVQTIAWAASNGDRSENGDYIYGKKRLREIDRRLRFLSKRLDIAEVVDPAQRTDNNDRVFFGATVTYANRHGHEHIISIVGQDEANASQGLVSWTAPIARAFMKAQEGDIIPLRTPAGVEELEILEIRYETIDPAERDPFAEALKTEQAA
jgi:transcription elongation factor GreB